MEIYENLFQGNSEPERTHAEKFDTFKPLNDLVLVKRYVEDNSMKGSFVVPERFREQSNRGIVKGVGQFVASDITAGDLVTFGIGNAENIIVNGEELLLIRDNDIRGYERAL